ncbi:MAG: response regulator [Patescibacteria group bacterium]
MKKLIFLVEDDSAIADIYRTIMEKSNLNVEIFGLGQDIIKVLKSIKAGEREKPDIILLDLILPDMNGIDVLKEIKSNEESKSIKVFILTNQGEVKFDQTDLRPDKVIIKANITPTQLVETIKKELK